MRLVWILPMGISCTMFFVAGVASPDKFMFLFLLVALVSFWAAIVVERVENPLREEE